MLMDALMGGLSLLDLPSSMIRDVAAMENPFDQWADPFGFEGRIDGRDVLEKWGVLGENQEGFDWGDVAGLAADVVLDPFTVAGVGRSALSKALGGQAAPLQAALSTGQAAPLQAALSTGQAAQPGMLMSMFRNPIKWDAPPVLGDAQAVRSAVSLPDVIEGPMTPWQAMWHNRRVNKLLEGGAMPAEAARNTMAKTIPKSEWQMHDSINRRGRLSSDEIGNELRSAWVGMGEFPPLIDESSFEPAKLYHGTSNPIPWGQLDIDQTSPRNLYGKGWYTTNSPGIGDSYVGKNTNVLSRFELSPRLFRNKASEAIESGKLSLRDSEEGDILRRWLSGEEVRSPDGTPLNQEVLLDDVSLNPGEYFEIEGVEDLWRDGLNDKLPWDNIEDVFAQSKIIHEHDPQAVTSWMIDSRNPLDMDAPLPGGGRESLESAVKKIVGDEVDPAVSVADDIERLRRYQDLDASEYATHPVIERLSGKGVSDNVRMYIESPKSWLDSMTDGYLTRMGLLKVRDIQDPAEAVDAAFKNLSKLSRSALDRNGPEGKLITSFLDHYYPQARSGKTLFDTVGRVDKGLDNIQHMAALAEDPRGLVADLLIARQKHTLSHDDLMRVVNNHLDIPFQMDDHSSSRNINEALQVLNDFQKRSGVDGMSAYDYAVQKTKDILFAVDVEADARSMAEIARESLENHIRHTAPDVRHAVDIAMPWEGEPTGVSLFKALQQINPNNTHEMFRKLGYDALTHTGGNRAGSGDYLHRVFIGLDPSKIYSGHAIAPDPVDVWTLQNVLHGMPYGMVPARAAATEMR